jgi:ATP-dependent helicase HrpB
MDLPIEAAREAFLASAARGHVALTAPTGSGKSTRVPLWCHESGERVLVVEPRRVACRSLARFVARQLGSRPGREVGYRHRHEDRTSEATRLVYVTPGTALRMLRPGGDLGLDRVILDEFHERHLQVDLLLALTRTLHPGLPLVVMSATMDVRALAGWLGAEAVEAAGRLHPVTVEHDAGVSVPTHRDLADRVAAGVRSVLDLRGDILVFLPGKAEIAGVRTRLEGLAGIEVLELHGALEPREQDRAFEPGEERRIILSTNVAESAVTLPRIGVVVDSGLERRTSFRDGRSVLELHVISRSSASQRSGRAGRLGPGHALRLWSRAARLEESAPPEIHRVGLMELVLEAACAGVPASRLDFPDPPRDYALADARTRLEELGAIDAAERLTDTGQRMMRFPLDPPLARVMVEAVDRGDVALLQDVVDLVSSLSTQRSPILPVGHGPQPELREELTRAGCDFSARILALRTGKVREHGLARGPLTEARREAGRLRRMLDLPAAKPGRVQRHDLARVFAAAWPRSVFVPHRRAGAFGNGHEEVVLGRESFAPASAAALVVAERRCVERRGRTVTLATCACPVPAQVLVDAPVGETLLVDARFVDGALVGVYERVIAGRALERHEEPARRGDAARAAGLAIWRGDLLGETAARLRDDVEAWNLSVDLGRTQAERMDARDWLVARIGELGVETDTDLALVSPADLLFPGLAPEERDALDRSFPRRLHLGRQVLRASYDPLLRQVTLEPEGGTGREPPPTRLLPPWPGWGVVYVDRGRSRRLR